ncbi:L-fuconate dehydratase [Mytilus galloprovincialis]|uniref:L-fuconate dehydratase n=1 Tax=Mytilus galloprovincialis TaxID=29158 RepID=A0A8B6GRW0_MYTGA|nr:L-fuconate dehydratase [Mytilus galloprovincialis]
MSLPTKITDLIVKDIRFPTSLEKDGSDAMHTAPDYSCAYVILKTDSKLQGNGNTFLNGRGTQIVCCAIEAFRKLVVGQKLADIFGNFGKYWQSLCSEDQIRWLGPEKGVTHLATAAIINALWDLWAKMEEKPLWKLLVDMEPEELVSVIDFRYMDDALTKAEAIELLKSRQTGKADREAELKSKGFPAYTTSCGWLFYPDDKIRKHLLLQIFVYWTSFQMFDYGPSFQSSVRPWSVVRLSVPDNRYYISKVKVNVKKTLVSVDNPRLSCGDDGCPLYILRTVMISNIILDIILTNTQRMCHDRFTFWQRLKSSVMCISKFSSYTLIGTKCNTSSDWLTVFFCLSAHSHYFLPIYYKTLQENRLLNHFEFVMFLSQIRNLFEESCAGGRCGQLY